MAKEYHLKYSNKNLSSFSRKRDFKKTHKNFFCKKSICCKCCCGKSFHFKKVTQELLFTIISRDAWKVRLSKKKHKDFQAKVRNNKNQSILKRAAKHKVIVSLRILARNFSSSHTTIHLQLA